MATNHTNRELPGGCWRIKDGFSSRSKRATCDVSEEDYHNLKEQIKSGQHTKKINCRLKCKIVLNVSNKKEISLISRIFQGNFHCMLILSLALLLVFYQQRVYCCEEKTEIWETTLDNWKKILGEQVWYSSSDIEEPSMFPRLNNNQLTEWLKYQMFCNNVQIGKNTY